VNGIPVFAKGADVIPFDSFPNRVTTAQYRRILQSAKDANMNMVRHWGGGYYESQEFYDICDELGLMVWQDMMFGNDWQPGTYDFKQQIEREAEYQMKRLRNHASFTLWSGNNETELVRDWNGRANDSADARMHLWENYLTEFSGILARTAARLDPEIPYWPSSPSADYEDVSDTYQSGDNHDWSVWHGNADFSEYEKRPWRFVSEYGFQSFPEMKTIESFTLPEDRTSIFTPVMLAHQKNWDGNKVIHDYMLRYFGEPKDFHSSMQAKCFRQRESRWVLKAFAVQCRRPWDQSSGS
jgi:beta-mannosidase